LFCLYCYRGHRHLHSFPTRRSSDLADVGMVIVAFKTTNGLQENHLNILQNIGITGGYTYPTLGMVAQPMTAGQVRALSTNPAVRSEEHTSELQSRENLVCRLLLEKK